MYFICDDTTHLLMWQDLNLCLSISIYCPKKLMLIFEHLQRAGN